MVPDVHGPNVQFKSDFWSDLHGKGADGVMMWSLYNTAFLFNFPDPKDCPYEGCDYDGKQITAKNAKAVGDEMAKFG